MKLKTKHLFQLTLLCMVLVGVLLIPQKTYAKDSDFVIENGVLTKYNGNDTNVTIPKEVTVIGNHAFDSCTSIKSVTLQSGVTEIGMSAFLQCYNLTTVSLPNTLKYIGDSAFCSCRQLKEISIPVGVISIGNNAFSGCSKLQSVKIADTVQSIGEGAFQYCNSLKTVSLPNGLEKIEGHVFGYCYALKNIKIPNTVKTVGDGVFNNCQKLTEIKFPQSVTSIGISALGNCYSLKTVVIENKNCTLKYNNMDTIFLDDGFDKKAYKKMPDTLTIKGYKGSTAEKIAKEAVTWGFMNKHIKFTDLSSNKSTTYGTKITSSMTVKKGKNATVKITLPKNVSKVSKFQENLIASKPNQVRITYKSNNKNIATVNSKGKVTGKKKGSTKITVTVYTYPYNYSASSSLDLMELSRTYTVNVKVK